jgi:hypothetical protein
MTMQIAAYYTLMTASILETAVSALILSKMVLGNAGAYLPVRAKWLMQVGQIGFTIVGLFIIFEANKSWPAYYCFLISIPFWFHFISQVGVLDFHLTRNLWSKKP